MPGRDQSAARRPRIRPLALCLIRNEDRILVFEGYDPSRKLTYYRPLGGGIEFGETGAEAVAREIREEIGSELLDVQFLRTFENIFTNDGQRGHEIVLLYEARLADESLYRREFIEAKEDDGAAFRAVWRSLSSFGPSSPLFPDGLMELLTSNPQPEHFS